MTLRTIHDCAARVSRAGYEQPCRKAVISIGGRLYHVAVLYRGLNRWEIPWRLNDRYLGHAPVKGEPRRSIQQNGPVRARERREPEGVGA